MTKVATIDTRRVLGLVMVAAMVIATLLAAMVPTVVHGEPLNDGITGTFTLGSEPPVVNSVSLWTAAGSEVTDSNVTPNAEYHVKVDITDTNTLNDLNTVTVILFYDSNGVYADNDENTYSDNTQIHATFKWTRTTDTYEKIGPSTGTWTTDNTGSVHPTLTASNGVFEFHIQVGKVATKTEGSAKWHIHAAAEDGGTPAHNTQQNLNVLWYGQIDALGTVGWGNATPGMGYAAAGAAISVKYTTNGHYHKSVTATSPWTGSPSGTATMINSETLSANEFSLKADDTTIPGGEHLLNLNPTYVDIGNESLQTDEVGLTEADNMLWLKLGTPFTDAVYSGTVYFQISNS